MHMVARRKKCPVEMIQFDLGCDVRVACKGERSYLDENMEKHLHAYVTKFKL